MFKEGVQQLLNAKSLFQEGSSQLFSLMYLLSQSRTMQDKQVMESKVRGRH